MNCYRNLSKSRTKPILRGEHESQGHESWLMLPAATASDSFSCLPQSDSEEFSGLSVPITSKLATATSRTGDTPSLNWIAAVGQIPDCLSRHPMSFAIDFRRVARLMKS